MNNIIEIEFENLVMKGLKGAGYPSDSIVPGWKYKNVFFDIAVIDQETQIPLMIIECKTISDAYSMKTAINQLRRYSDLLDYPVKTCAAFYTGDQKFEFYDFTKKVKDSQLPISACGPIALPSYEEIKTGAKSKFFGVQKAHKERYINGLKIFCWGIIPTLIVTWFVLDALSLYPLTTERLILSGTLILSLLLPFFGEIKVGEVILSNKKKGGEK